MRRILCLLTGMILLGSAPLFAADAVQGQTVKTPAITKKVLIVYYSRTGNTKRIAEDVARGLNADIEQLIDKKDRSGASGYMSGGKDATLGKLTELEPVKYDPASYDLVVLGTPVWSWTMTPAIRTYITEHKAALKEIACFTSAGGTKPGRIVTRIEELSGKKAIATAGFFDRDLKEKNRVSYEEKLNAFIGSLK